MNIVFLDIDGVLQPYDAEYGLLSTDSGLIKKLSFEYGVDYSKYDYSDVASTCYDWNEQAVSRLKYILDKTESKIIVSSDWRRTEKIYKMKHLLRIRGLDSYWLGDNIVLDKSNFEGLAARRAAEISNSLKRFSITNFAILDDLKELRTFYPDNCVITHNIISIDNMNDCIKLLKRKK